MISLSFRKREKRDALLGIRAIDALAIMLLLTQLPHVLHLPIWVSVFGVSVIILKWRNVHTGAQSKLSWALSSRLTVAWAMLGGVLIKLHFGYFLGRDPCVAFLFFLVSCKFAETKKQSDATTLLCLSGFLLLTQYFYSQTILSAVLTIPAVLALGYALSVLTEHTPRQPKKHRKLVARLLVQGLPIAAVLFVLFPRLPGPLWSLPDDSTASTGLSDSMSPGEIGNLSQSAEVAFRVEFDGAPPESSMLYWRGPVLSNFDGKNWTVNELTDTDRIENASLKDTISYTVTLQPHKRKWLFALEQAASLPKPLGSRSTRNSLNPVIRSDKQISSSAKINTVTHYKQTSLLSDRHTPTKAPGAVDLHLAGKNPKTTRFADEMFRMAKSERAYISQVLAWFTNQPYHYTLQPSVLGDSPIDEFMFETRSGFCGHYASAFVVMMRSVGIPARIVTGYQGGEMNGEYMIVRQSEAHAWTEVYTGGQWVRFDPTAAVAPSRVDRGLASALPNDSRVPMLAKVGNGWLKRASLRWDAVNHGWQRMIVDFNNDSQMRFWKKLGMPEPALWQLTAILLLLAASWCMWMLKPSNLSAAALNRDEKEFQRYCRLLNDAGVKRSPGETGAQLTDKALLMLPDHQELIRRIGMISSKLRFEPLSDGRRTTLRAQMKRDLKKLNTLSRRIKSAGAIGRTIAQQTAHSA